MILQNPTKKVYIKSLQKSEKIQCRNFTIKTNFYCIVLQRYLYIRRDVIYISDEMREERRSQKIHNINGKDSLSRTKKVYVISQSHKVCGRR